MDDRQWIIVTHDMGEEYRIMAIDLGLDQWLLTVAHVDIHGEPVRHLVSETDDQVHGSVRDALIAGFAQVI